MTWSTGVFVVAGLSVIVVVNVLVLSTKWHKSNPNRRISQPSQFLSPPGGRGVMYTHVVGLLTYKSTAWYLPAVVGFFVAVPWITLTWGQGQLPIAVLGVPAALLLFLPLYLRPKRAVQRCYVHPNGAITLIRGDVGIPFDLNHFPHVRMYEMSSARTSRPGMLVLYHDTRPSFGTWMGSALFPRVDSERVVLLFNSWRDDEGYVVGPLDMDGLFYQACLRAGRTPTQRRFSGGWEVRPH